MGFFTKERCPVCGREIGALTKSLAKYNKSHLCKDCCTNIGKAGVLLAGLDRYSLPELQKMAGVKVKRLAERSRNNVSRNSVAPYGKVTATKEVVSKQNVDAIRECFISVDLETTGLDSTTDRIVEIGAIKFRQGKPVEEFSTLVNPGCPIPYSATEVNNITDEMVADAPKEKKALKDFLEFIGEAKHGEIFLCAHNADFDMGFIRNSLARDGFDASFRYVDTLYLSKRCLPLLENYKQGTVAAYFDITNDAAHRASSDAMVCGRILLELLPLVEACKDFKNQSNLDAGKEITKEELEVCAYIQKIILDKNCDIDILRFRKNSSGYVDVMYMYPFTKFKFSKKGKYIIIDSSERNKVKLPVEECSISEGGKDSIRVYFDNPEDLLDFAPYMIKKYRETMKSARHYLAHGNRSKVNDWINELKSLSVSEMTDLIRDAEQREYTDVKAAAETGEVITREMVTVNAVNRRCALSEIKNLHDERLAFDRGYPLYELGEEKRKAGEIEDAIFLYDRARSEGYNSPALYEAYAKAYSKLKDYDNVIVIIEEYLDRNGGDIAASGRLETRRDKAIKELYKRQQKEKRSASE